MWQSRRAPESTDATIGSMPMRERRSAHVRPRPPSSDRLPDRTIRASAPPVDIMRRYRSPKSGPRVSPPVRMVLVCAAVVLGLLTLTVGATLAANAIGGLSNALSNSFNRVASQGPAPVPPSGAPLDTPVLDAPPNNGYTNQGSVLLQGSLPAESVGKKGYTVHVYLQDKNGTRREVARLDAGGTTRFTSPPLSLAEGNNLFTATLATPNGESSASPPVTYILDTALPKISVKSPASGAKVTTSKTTVSGTCDVGATISIRNEQAPGGAYSSLVVGSDGSFTFAVPVVAGPNTIDLAATDRAGNSSSSTITIKRDYGQLAAHLAATPSKFASSSKPTLKLTMHATSFNGGALANAKVTFTVMVQGLGPIVSPEMTTDATGTATWQVVVSGATVGIGQASVLVTSPDGDQVTATATITTT